jgi:hypothetical protein
METSLEPACCLVALGEPVFFSDRFVFFIVLRGDGGRVSLVEYDDRTRLLVEDDCFFFLRRFFFCPGGGGGGGNAPIALATSTTESSSEPEMYPAVAQFERLG